MRILILGCNSFFARASFSKLYKRENEILGISRSTLHEEIKEKIQNNLKNEFRFYKLDFVKDFEMVTRKIILFRPQIIIDALGEGLVNPSWAEPDKWIRTNVEYKIKLVRTLIETGEFPQKYIKISTPEVYGSFKGRVKENRAHNPSTPYAVSHSTIDRLLYLYFKVNQFPSIFARFANFYGPRQQNYRIIPLAINNALNLKPFPLEGDGKTFRTFIFKSDIAYAIESLIKHGNPGEVYHFGTDELISMKSLVTTIYKMVNPKHKVQFLEKPARVYSDLCYRLDCRFTTMRLGWKPKVELSKGLSITLDSMLSHNCR